ncbi:MAG: WG repeat-containing protein [Bacteroidota bacterium]|nr:WG repeat-containing protein [Bacteroidota bacterium]
MFNFLKKLFGGSKEEEQGGYIPQEYVIPKKTPPVENIKDEPAVDKPFVVTFSESDSVDLFDETLASVEKKTNYSIEEEWELFEENGKSGFKDENGNIIIPAKFDNADYFINGRAIVTVKEKKGVIDAKGNYILEPTYDYIDDERAGFFRLETRNRLGFANRNGKIVIPLQYLDAGEVSEGLVWVEKEDALVGFVDMQGKKVIDFIFDYCGDFSEGLASATKYAQEEGQEDVYGYINKKGNFVIKMDLDDSGDFKEGLAPVCINNKYGFINKKGDLICEPIFSSAGNFVQGLSCVQMEGNGKYGYADKTGKLVIPCTFKDTSDYMEDEELNEFITELKQKFFIK